MVPEGCKDGRDKGLENLGIMVPALDIINHNSEQEWLTLERSDSNSDSDSDSALKVICNVPRSKGEELFSNYGSLSNEKLLYAYGFAAENNEEDDFCAKLVVQKGEGNTPMSRVFHISRGGIAGVPPALWRVLSGGYAGGGVEEEIGEEEEGPVEVDLDDLSTLFQFINSKYNNLVACTEEAAPAMSSLEKYASAGDVRAQYIKYYLEGQRAILEELYTELKQNLEDEDGEEEEEV